MCGGVFYSYQTKNIITYFTQATAQLPALTKTDKTVLLPWGRRTKQIGQLPLGGWLQYETLNNGIYDEYFPKLVRLPLLKFMQSDIEDMKQWFDVTAGQYVQGVVLQHDKEQRAYIVVITPTQRTSAYERWPKIISQV
jgi:hypothetical protein